MTSFFFFVTARLHWPKLWLNLTSKWPKGLRRTGYSRHGFSTDVRIATGCQILDGVLQLCSHPAHVETKPCFSHTWKWHQNRLREMTYLASSLDRRHRYGHWLHAVLDTAWSRLVSSNYKAAWTHFLWGKLRSKKKMFHYCYHCKERIRGVRSNNNDTFYIALYPCKWAHALYYIRNTEIVQIKNLYKSTEKLFFLVSTTDKYILLCTHTSNKQWQTTALDRQGHNVLTQTPQPLALKYTSRKTVSFHSL